MQFKQLQSLESFPAPIHLSSLLPSWAQPKAFTNLGNNIHDDISREKLVVVHSEGKEAQKLECLQSSEAVLMWEIGFFGVLH